MSSPRLLFSHRHPPWQQQQRRRAASCMSSPFLCSLRFFHAATGVCHQRPSSSSSSWRGRRASSSTSYGAPSLFPTFRPPTQNLLSPFGAVLHGASRQPRATFAEPLDAWLAVLADSVPFYKDCLLICPSTATPAQVQHAWDRCRVHMPTAHVGKLRPRNNLRDEGTASAAAVAAIGSTSTHLPPQLAIGGAASSVPAVAATAGPTCSSTALSPSAPSRSLPPLRSPLEDVPPSSLDLVVLAGNVFAHEMLFDAPWHLSLAHRALRPHGVVAIVGHVADAAVVAPDWAAESCAECLSSLHGEARSDLELLGVDAVRHLPASSAHENRLKHAVEVQETLRTAHSDVFFPFPSVRRRWFTSEYAMHPSQLIASCRAAAVYQALYSPAGSLWRSKAHHVLQQQQKRGGEGDGDLFVDVTQPPAMESMRSVVQDGLLDDTWSPAGVQRRRGAIDPLDALQAILEAHTLGLGADSRVRRRLPAEPPLRVEMRHFVVTCSTRSMNATPDAAPEMARLPSSAGARGMSLPSSHRGSLPRSST